jgi:iron complex transport system substrate-binding protein
MAAPVRIVSVVPAATEIITALGAGNSLVGVSHECVVRGRAAPTPRVTDSALATSRNPGEIDAEVAAMSHGGVPLFSLQASEIATLQPDVIITQNLCGVCAVSEPDVQALAARMIPQPRIVTMTGSTLDGVFADIAAVADAVCLSARGEALVASLRARMKRVHTILATARAPRPRVAVLEWTDPLYAAGHWVPEMVYRAGGADVLATAGQHSRQVSPEAVTEAAPEIILIAPCAYGIDRAAREGRELLDRWVWMKDRPVWALDAVNLVSQPGPGLVDGIETMAALFNPQLFDAPTTSRAVPLTT